jgi:upstream activation factor subunit UAF30
MAEDIVSLEPAVYEILTAPGVNLSTISAKHVRKQLSAQNPDLEDWIRDNKVAIGALIARVFTQLQPLASEEQSEAGPSESHQSPEGTQEVEEDEGGEDEDAEMEREEEKRPAKKPRKKKPLTDEEYAKQLSSEINGRTRSSRSGASTPKRSRGGKSKRNISAATVDSDDDGDEVGKKRKKSSSGGGARGGFSKEYILRYFSLLLRWCLI